MRRTADRFLALLRSRHRTLLVVFVLMYVIEGFHMQALPGDSVRGNWRANVFELVRSNCAFGCFTIAAVLLAEALPWRGAWRASGTVALLVFGNAIGATLMWLISDGSIALPVKNQVVQSNMAFTLRFMWIYTAYGVLLALYFAGKQREVDASLAARAAELNRARSQRAVVESRLKVLQARVEPEFLFGALADLEGLYRRDAAAANRMLDELIAYLRAVLPHVRAGVSTLGQEITLAQTYLSVASAGRRERLLVPVDVAPRLLVEPFPPMVLLPLVHAAQQVGALTVAITGHAPDTPRRSIAWAALSVTIEIPDIPTGWTEDSLASVRGRLQQYFGAEAGLTVEASADGVRALISWPLHSEGDAPGPIAMEVEVTSPARTL